MRRALLLSSIFSACTCVFFFACGETQENPTTDGSSIGEDGGGSQGSSTGGFGNGGLPDGGSSGGSVVDSGARLQNGCLLFATPMASGKKVENVPRGGGVNWTNLPGAQKEDDQQAAVVLDKGQDSAVLRVSDFDLKVPGTAETWGIVVELKRRALNDQGILQTEDVNVAIPNKTTQFKFDNEKFFWPRTIIGTHPYGQEVDTWGVDLQPSDVDTPALAATLVVKRGVDNVQGPITGVVDALRVQVWYATGNEQTCQK